MCFEVIIRKKVYVDADSAAEAEELALEGNDLFGVEEEVLSVSRNGNTLYYSCGGCS